MGLVMKVDITERLDAGVSLNHSDYLLVRELTHRIKNELTSVIGHASLLAARSASDEVKAALARVTQLLHYCADVHRALEKPTHSTIIDLSNYTRTLCQSISRARLNDRGIELVLSDHPLQMRSERCWLLGMILSELISNSARHALGGHGGQIHVKLSRAGSYVQCSVTDNGSSRGPGTPGQGLTIVEALVKELDGEIVHRFGAEGALSILIFPLGSNIPQMDNDPWIEDQQRDGPRSVAYPL
jgi:two-component sensor histidine kinase